MAQAHSLGNSLFRAAQGSLSGSVPDQLSINSGEQWCVVRSEESTERELDIGGQQVAIELTVVGEAEDFRDFYPSTPQQYIGKTAVLTHGDKETSYRVGRFTMRGEFFVQIDLIGVEEA